MTWGELRLQLSKTAPGVDHDILDEFLNNRYEQVLEACDWKDARYHATIQTVAAYTTGTVTFTVGSANVTGSGTGWVTGQTGMKMYRPGDQVLYTFTWLTGTTGTLDRVYEGMPGDAAGKTYTASTYVLMQNVYQLPADVRSVLSILNPVTNLPLLRFSKEKLDEIGGPRTLVQDPESFADYDDSAEASPPVVHQIELYPPPQYARGYSVEYVHTAVGFDGGNTSGSPLPFVTQNVLLYGCRADLATYMASKVPKEASAHLAVADRYEKQFQMELARILRLEHMQRRPQARLQMADRFTRHRMTRASRGLNRTWGPSQGGPN